MRDITVIGGFGFQESENDPMINTVICFNPMIDNMLQTILPTAGEARNRPFPTLVSPARVQIQASSTFAYQNFASYPASIKPLSAFHLLSQATSR